MLVVVLLLCLNWNGEGSPPTQWWLLVERTGARPGYTSLTLDGGVKAWRFENLSRHQRYRIQVRAPGDQASACVDVLPREGSTAVTEQGAPMPQAGITQLLVMPQNRRLTAYWTLSSGFVDRTVVAVHVEGRLLGRWELEPEVRSLSVDAARVAALQNGMVCDVTVATRLGTVVQDVMTVRAVPAPQGREREANRALTQAGLVYPCLSLTDELDLFGDANARPPGRGAVRIGSRRHPTSGRLPRRDGRDLRPVFHRGLGSAGDQGAALMQMPAPPAAVASAAVASAAVWANGSKAEALVAAREVLTTARVLPLFYFDVGRWWEDRDEVLAELSTHHWSDEPLIVRSSAEGEDDPSFCEAGLYLSVRAVVGPAALADAVDAVIASYATPGPGDQVLIQPELHGAMASGVAFSCDPAIGNI